MPETYEALSIGDVQVLQFVDGRGDFAFSPEGCYPGVDIQRRSASATTTSTTAESSSARASAT